MSHWTVLGRLTTSKPGNEKESGIAVIGLN